MKNNSYFICLYQNFFVSLYCNNQNKQNMKNYEMLYKDTLKRAHDELNNELNSANAREVIKRIFPKIAESEDERIRKELIDLIYKVYANTNYITCEKHEEFLAWLEKQGKSKTSDTLIWGCVDLGLPSGTLWAAMNVGASNETDAGLYFAWGETQGYAASQVGVDKIFTWNDYKFGKWNDLSKYNSTDGLTTLEPTDDAAYALSNGQYIMPTKEQFEELIEHTTSRWDDDRKGYVFVSKINGSELFFPAAGLCKDGSVNDVGDFGFLWGSALYTEYVSFAWYFLFNSAGAGVYNFRRVFGQSVRGVVGQNLL